MKNERIVRAYDSINPTAQEKERMLRNILSEANLESPTRKYGRNRESRVYTQVQSADPKRGSIWGAVAAAAVLCLVAGLGFAFLMRRTPVDPAYAEPTSEVVFEKTAWDHYAPVLEKYRRAAEEGWSKEQCANEGISLRMQEGYDISKAGYALLDLDGDGREELIIAEESTDRTDNIWDLYTTQEDGTPIHLWADELGGVQCRLYENNIISISDSYKDTLDMIFYVLEGGQLVVRESLRWEDEDTVFHTDGDGNTRQVTSREGQEISYSYEGKKLQLNWFTDMPEYLRDAETMEQYLPVLEKYQTAIDEDWNRTMCNGNGMSMLTPIESDYEGLFYAMYDLNGDGSDELILSEYPYREDTDTSFIDIYTVYEGEVKNVMSLFELGGMRSLCEEGLVKDLYVEPGMAYDNYVGFWRLEGDLFVTDSRVYQKDGQWYTEGYRGVGAQITREEADQIVENYQPLKLEFTQIRPSGETKNETGYEAFDRVIRKYVTALTENWTAEQCEQNDISPAILDEATIQFNLSWTLLDIDSNGVEELIISDGVHLFDLYVMMPHDGNPGHLLMANGGTSYSLCEDGTIEQRDLFSKGSSWKYYALSDLELKLNSILIYRNEYEGTTAKEGYYYGPDEDSLQPVSKEKAGDIMSEHQTADLVLHPFVEVASFAPNEVDYYDPLLETYRQAIREDWGPGDCAHKGISLMIGYYGDLYGELGYSLMDLNGDSIDELIITDGSNIFDLYTIIQDEETGPLHLICAMERLEYRLLKGLKIYCRGSGGAARVYHTLYMLDDRELVALEGYAFDADTDPENPWFYYDGETVEDPCGSFDSEPIINDYLTMSISNTKFE